MKIGRFETTDGLRFWALVDENAGTARELGEPFAKWAPRLALAHGAADVALGPEHPLSELRLCAPLDPGARIFGTGMNYESHLHDAPDGRAVPIPTEMPGFIKLESTLVAPDGEIRYPSTTDQLDYEIEIVAVLAKELEPGRPATESLLGYTLGNDVSPRDVGSPTGGVDLYSMKAQDGTAPVGPWVASLGSLGGPGQPSFDFRLTVNDELRQQDNTSNMLWSVERILAWINQRNRLRAGDLVFTGTTAGTGMKTGRFLAAGDVVELEADGIGVLRNRVGAKERSDAQTTTYASTT
jgi:2-keto-4-pentenoate hydratase/2-oxohepta-3-ene-1,7-dioic acid hydratase in catechol pathway